MAAKKEPKAKKEPAAKKDPKAEKEPKEPKVKGKRAIRKNMMMLLKDQQKRPQGLLTFQKKENHGETDKKD